MTRAARFDVVLSKLMRIGMIALLAAVLATGCYRSNSNSDAGNEQDAWVGEDADARQFCVDQGFWECRRDQFAGRITTEEFNTCISSIMPRCEGFAWPAGCRPTEFEASACITILQRGDLAPITTDELYAMYTECDLCP